MENTNGRIHETTTADKCSETGKEQGQIDPDHPVLAGSLGNCRPYRWEVNCKKTKIKRLFYDAIHGTM